MKVVDKIVGKVVVIVVPYCQVTSKERHQETGAASRWESDAEGRQENSVNSGKVVIKCIMHTAQQKP